ncbi:sarcosine oxidase subunit gamma [Paludibacterium yongneupense]|uniref:sarcosine oxidase subunit gamma n=1 Tax=Paludibacterium yongneupense TaxID=400061 RepID=UPI00040B0B4A|nr:sarcosine oxidase subunit gamma family protein [Paludibacterium yongneupense]
MSDALFQPYARSPLDPLDLAGQAVRPSPENGAWANEVRLLAYLTLRGDSADPAYARAVRTVCGLSLPDAGRYVSGVAGVLLWRSPNECLLLTSRRQAASLRVALVEAFAGLLAEVVDQSGGLTTVYLAGAEQVTVLRHMGGYDFGSLEPGQAIATVFGKTAAVVMRADAHGVHLIVRRSFAAYLWALLARSARPYAFTVGRLPAAGTDPVLCLQEGATVLDRQDRVAV